MSDDQPSRLQRSVTTPARQSPSSPDDPTLKRAGSSALARFTRSVSKLRTKSHRRKPSDTIIDEEEGDATATGAPAGRSLRRSQTEAVTYTGKLGGGSGGGSAPIVARDVPPRRVSSPVRGPSLDLAAFLRAVPEMSAADLRVSGAQMALRSTETLAKSLRIAATDAALVLGAETGERVRRTSARLSIASSLLDTLAWERALHAVESAVAEQRFRDALEQLKLLEALLKDYSNKNTREPSNESSSNLELQWRLQEGVVHWNSAVAEALELHLAVPSMSGRKDILQNTRLLAALSSPMVALNVLIRRYSHSLLEELDGMPLTAQAGATGPAAEAAAADLAAAMGQALATTLAEAFSISYEALDGSDCAPHVRGVLTQWALEEVRSTCNLLRRLVILPLASPAGLKTTCICAAAFLAYCQAIGADFGIPAGAIAQDSIWPAVEAVLQRRLRQLAEGLKKAVQTDVATAAAAAAVICTARPALEGSTWDYLLELYPSAGRLLLEIKAMAEDLKIVAGSRAVAAVRHSLSTLFVGYTDALVEALASRNTSSAESTCAAEVAMEVSTRLVEGLLAESLESLGQLGWGHAVDAVQLVVQLEKMAAALCMESVPE